MSQFLAKGYDASPMTGAEIATAYEAQADRNPFTDARLAEVAENTAKNAQNAAKTAIITRSAYFLEAMSDQVFPDAQTDSTAGMAAALAQIGSEGGGTLMFPREAEFRGKIADIPANVVIDFNGSKITPLGNLDECIRVEGAESVAKFSLASDAKMLAASILVTGFVAGGGAVGQWIWIYDDSSRLTGGAVDINNNIRQVVGIDAGTPDRVYLDMPLSFKKSMVTSGRRNVSILTMKQGVKLLNARTEPSQTSTHGTGIYPIWCRDLEIHNHTHTEGAGAPGQYIRACVDVRGSGLKIPGVRVASTYGLLMNQGTRDLVIDGVTSHGDRHTVDMDSVDQCKVINATSISPTSTPFGMAHNGVGGYGNTIEGTVYNAPDGSGGYCFNTRGFKAVTGQGDSDMEFPILSPRLRIKAFQKRGAELNTGVLFAQPFRDADLAFELVNGDGESHDAMNSVAFRYYPNGNTGRVRLDKVRGYRFGVFADNDGNATKIGRAVRFEMPSIDYFNTAFWTIGADGLNIGEVNAGENQNDVLFKFDQPASRRLIELDIGRVTMDVANAEGKTIAVSGADVLGYTHGAIGSILTREAEKILSRGADFTLTLDEIISHGKRAIRIDGTAACRITEIEKGAVIGQQFSLWSSTAGTHAVTIEGACANYYADATKTLGFELLRLEWDGATWIPMRG